MFDDFNICPYTGLRSFTEEESIYFKGRDEHILQATAQLEKNKFLMLTGASGDGKSSLVYAGIIPNARSGFLKATYSNWQVIDFRPERSPMQNLCESIGRGLDISNIDTIKAELQHGFSALIDLYRSSKRFNDENSNEWQQANDTEKAAITRDAANIIILADQFEEFFTNPENYQRGVPSVESSMVLNILLETARIALEENLPIYVIFTMRSDYIGQCAAFRGLPEYIGFSQFFVPRMNRKQLQEVIEEPAVLSGNTITRRLTERLIEDITDGTDQLPMLQHALNQIWKMADSGKEEMDLIHYAMVGGIASADLPDADQQRFVKWFDELPKKIKICYDESSLQNVLNTHANKLNNHAADYVANHNEVTVSEDDAKLIIKNTFQCLTKINEGRAVRNRMTLDEITKIINKPHIDATKVNLVLNVYRDVSNTLLKPFIGEQNEDTDLEGEAVLDITHESLIRNWTRLGEWAKAELEDYTIFLDFRQQLQRWVDNDRSGDFLLSIGPLTYFEAWFNKKQPNKYWVARYETDEDQNTDKIAQAAGILTDAQSFIKTSVRKHIITRTVMKYGPRRIAAVLAIIAVLVFSSFTLKNYLDRRNSSMRAFFVKEMGRYANDKEIRDLNITSAFTEQLRLQDVTVDGFLNKITNHKTRAHVAVNQAFISYSQAADASEPFILRLMVIADSILNAESNKPAAEQDIKFILSESNNLMPLAMLADFISPGLGFAGIIESTANREKNLILEIVDNNITDFGPTFELNDAIEYALNEKAFSVEEIKHLLAKLSPFEVNYQQSSWLQAIYAKPQIYKLSNTDFGFNFNGLYQEVAYLYAGSGNVEMALNALDSLLYYDDTYPNQSYLANTDNAFNIGQYFINNRLDEAHKEFVSAYCIKDGVNEVTYYEYLTAKSHLQNTTGQKLSSAGFGFINRHHNANIDFITVEQISYLSEKLRGAINNSALSSTEKQFKLALSYKNEGLKLARLLEQNKAAIETEAINLLFEQSIGLYTELPATFLSEPIEVTGTTAINRATAPRKYLFLYPDKRYPFNTQPLFDFQYSSPAFLQYIMANNYFSELYAKDDVEWIDEWFIEYAARYTITGLIEVTKLTYEFDKELLSTLVKNNARTKDQFNLLYLTLGNYAAGEEDFGAAITFFDNVNMSQIIDILGSNFRFIGRDVLRRLAQANSAMMRVDRIDLADKFIEAFNNPINRSSIYAYSAKESIISHGKYPYVDQLIDSSIVEMARVENANWQPNKLLIAAALSFRNQSGDVDLAYKVIKNVAFKSAGIWWISRGYAFNNELYKSYQAIPHNLSDDDVCGYLYEVYHNYEFNNRTESAYWRKYNEVNDNADARIFYVR